MRSRRSSKPQLISGSVSAMDGGAARDCRCMLDERAGANVEDIFGYWVSLAIVATSGRVLDLGYGGRRGIREKAGGVDVLIQGVVAICSFPLLGNRYMTKLVGRHTTVTATLSAKLLLITLYVQLGPWKRTLNGMIPSQLLPGNADTKRDSRISFPRLSTFPFAFRRLKWTGR